MKCYDITVIVGTFNPDWIKLKATLLSILQQSNIKFQIVVSDDGSSNPLHNEIKELFNQTNFTDYKLVGGEMNEGTVCQFYRGICASDAEYIKPISPGDLLYDDIVLSKWLTFSKENNADITFGDAVFYNCKNGILNVVKHSHNPKNMQIYKNNFTYRDRVINYICLGDVISGATKIAKRDILMYYMELLLHRVIYVEDFFIRLAVLDERKLFYYPSKVIWYEFADGGISTTGVDIWKKRIRKDNIAMDEICLEKWVKQDTEICSWLLENIKFKKNDSPTMLERLVRYLKHPEWLYWKIYSVLFGEHSPVDVDETFYNNCYRDTLNQSKPVK